MVKIRRAGARWRKDAPEWVVDCFDDPAFADRYSVLIKLDDDYLAWLGMSGAPTHPQGISQWSETEHHQATMYRYENGKHRIAWLDLPADIRAHVIARVAETNVEPEPEEESPT